MADTATPPAAPKARLNRWLAAGLIVSVAINLALVGFAATRFYKYRSMDRMPASHAEEQVARRLPDHAAQAFRKAVEESRKPGLKPFHEMRRELAETLAAEPFDRARFASLLAQHRDRLADFQQGMQAGLLAAADAMTPAERREYSERLLHMGPPGMGHRRDRGDRRGGPDAPPPPR